MAETDYERGKRDAEVIADRDLSAHAHARLDKMEPRLTAIERFMYAGMGMVLVLNVLPIVEPWLNQ